MKPFWIVHGQDRCLPLNVVIAHIVSWAPRTCCLSGYVQVQVCCLQSLHSTPCVPVSAAFVSRFPVSSFPLWRREHEKIPHTSALGGCWGYGTFRVHLSQQQESKKTQMLTPSRLERGFKSSSHAFTWQAKQSWWAAVLADISTQPK